MLPVKVIFATTTGTAQRYADLLRKEAFAMHVSGFHFEVTCVNAANYIMDDIEKERLVVFLLPTWTGGVPAASAKMLCDHVADMAQDFRVSKDHMARTRFAVFGLGSAEYDKNFCRAAAELDGHLQTLGAEPLCALGRGDDSVDMEAQFAAWRERLWPVLCEVFARECGGAPAGSGEAAAAAGSGCGSDCGSGGDVTSSSQVYRRPAGGVFSDDDEEFVDADDNDDDDGAAPGASAAAGAGSGCCGGSGGGGSGKAAGGECCGGSGACADSASSSSAASVAGSTAGGSSVDPSAGLLPRKEYRKKLKAMTPAEKRAYVATRRAITTAAAGVPVGPAPGSASAARKAAGAGDAGAASGAGAVSEEGEEGAAGGGGEPEFNEEDLLNDALLAEGEGEGAGALDSDDEGGAGAGAGAAAVMGAGSGSGSGEGLADLEDLGTVISAAAAEKRAEAAAAASGAPREMVTPAQRRALTKEGYKLIGSHSAVKICRWTKSMLRGNGGCYKHSLYAIASHLCMEVTPSLACANKCVFCWRHHKNPVGREWRWQIDAPEMIVEEAIAKHVAQIKMLKGLPGLREDRWREAMTPRHCALSLVGEPIMYPHIGQLLRLLHGRDISTFLVTNAQFPDAIAALPPVTQLYVSIDAATKDTLKAIDRPLFADFWERFLGACCAACGSGCGHSLSWRCRGIENLTLR
jgi:flavodoxin